MNINKLKKFIEDRPMITERGLSVESQLSPSTIGKVLKGDIKLSERIVEKITPIMKRYGYLHS